MRPPAYVECQTCGTTLYGPLSPAEEQAMARNPGRFILDCRTCTERILKDLGGR